MLDACFVIHWSDFAYLNFLWEEEKSASMNTLYSRRVLIYFEWKHFFLSFFHNFTTQTPRLVPNKYKNLSERFSQIGEGKHVSQALSLSFGKIHCFDFFHWISFLPACKMMLKIYEYKFWIGVLVLLVPRFGLKRFEFMTWTLNMSPKTVFYFFLY